MGLIRGNTAAIQRLGRAEGGLGGEEGKWVGGGWGGGRGGGEGGR